MNRKGKNPRKDVLKRALLGLSKICGFIRII
jgi:hypothetical protein